jgi:hypothetical protein
MGQWASRRTCAPNADVILDEVRQIDGWRGGQVHRSSYRRHRMCDEIVIELRPHSVHTRENSFVQARNP